jgi:folate-binding protein YgfZ
MSPNDSVSSPRNTAEDGWVDLPDLCVVSFHGSDARDFLGRQLTCDMAQVVPGVPAFGAWLTPKGRVLALLRVVERAPNRFDAVICAQLAEGLIRRMRLFVMRDDVTVDVDSQQSVVGLWGGCAKSWADSCAESFATVRAPAPSAPTLISIATNPALAMAIGSFDALHDALGEHVNRQGKESQWRRLCIEAGLPQLESATQEAFIPQMINLDRLDAVSFNKGCYPGQEIVARTQHLGRIKRRMFIATVPSHEIERVVEPGDVIVGTQGEDIGGRVLNVERGTRDTVLLAVLPLNSDSPTPSVRIHDASGPLLMVSAPPYSLADPAD